jgi:hypothetical protein
LKNGELKKNLERKFKTIDEEYLSLEKKNFGDGCWIGENKTCRREIS